MSQLSRFAACSAAVCLLALFGCEPPAVEPELSLGASPRTLDGVAQRATITLNAVDDKAKPGTGVVKVTSSAGSLKAGVDVDVIAGEGTVELSCSRSMDPGCTGIVRITAEWTTRGKTATASTSITVTPAVPVVDAGTDAGMDAGTDAGIDAGPPIDAGLTLMASAASLFIGTQGAVTLTANLTGLTPAAGHDLQFSTTAGLLRANPDAGTSSVITVRTDSLGNAAAQLVDGAGQMAALATVTVTHAPTSKTATAQVDLLALRQVSHVDTRCGSTTNCALMGVRGSGYQEAAQVTFRVTDALGRPAVGARVNFVLNTPPFGVMLDRTSEITDNMGLVTAAVQSGTALGVFSVQAVVVPGQVEGSSPTLAIRGAKPANKQFRLYCASVNIAAYKSANPPLPLTVMCTVRVVDRNNNPVGTGLSVSLKTEAGNVGNSVATAAFMNNNANEGLGTFAFDTTGGVWPPVDTVPLPANATQFPFPRATEPQRPDGLLIRNPRDGLITIMAYVVGEEHFDDNNGNGVYDVGEPFVDQGEPFVDSNDNNIWDPGEFVVPELINGVDNGVWDPPNNVYDRNKLIWTEAKILATNSALPGAGTVEGPNPGLCPAGIPKGGFADFTAHAPDLNLNRVQSGSTVTVSRLGTRGTITLPNTFLLDGYGFEFERVLVDATNPTQACTSTTPRCNWLSAFGVWERGRIATVRVVGVPAADVTMCADEPGLTLETNVLSTTVSTATFSFGVQ